MAAAVRRCRLREDGDGQVRPLSEAAPPAKLTCRVVVLLRHAQLCGFDLRTIGTVFELGCGDGRLLRHFRHIQGIRLIGSDTRPEAVEWCQQNLPGPEHHVNAFNPPLQFLGGSSVDLTYALSVFTHIPLRTQEAWLGELHRITRPGGFLLLTVIGRRLKQWLPAHRREELERTGELEISSTDPNAHLATQLEGSLWDVYQSRERIFEVFGKVFEIADYVDEDITALGQDLVVLRKADEPHDHHRGSRHTHQGRAGRDHA